MNQIEKKHAALVILNGFARIHGLKTYVDREGFPYVNFRHRMDGFVKIGIALSDESMILHWAWWSDDYKHGTRRVSGGRQALKSLDVIDILTEIYKLTNHLESMETNDFPIAPCHFDWLESIPEKYINDYTSDIKYIQNLGSELGGV